MGGQKWPPIRRDSTEKVRHNYNYTMEQPKVGALPQVGLAKQAYVGAPKPLGNNVLGSDSLQVHEPRPHWSYKSRKLRRQEIIDDL